jgi:hypothetical protein
MSGSSSRSRTVPGLGVLGRPASAVHGPCRPATPWPPAGRPAPRSPRGLRALPLRGVRLAAPTRKLALRMARSAQIPTPDGCEHASKAEATNPEPGFQMIRRAHPAPANALAHLRAAEDARRGGQRSASGRFAPGQSGSTNTRFRQGRFGSAGEHTRETSEWKEWCRGFAADNRAAIAERALTDIRFLTFIIEQGHGRAAQSIEAKVDTSAGLRALTDDELNAKLKEKLEQLYEDTGATGDPG